MMHSTQREIELVQVDVFAEHPFEGNPAGVVPNAEGLSPHQMQQIARELNCSETAFLLPPTDDTHDVWVRFFTPTTEVPLCGHASLAAQSVFACRYRGATRSSEPVTIRQGAAGGGWTVTVSDHGCYAEMLQVPVTFRGGLDSDRRRRLGAALGIGSDDLDPRCPIEIHSTGHAKVLVGIKKRAVLDRIRPNLSELVHLGAEIGSHGFFLFTLDVDEPGVTSDCRMFAPGIGIAEDPVTGSGQGPLGAYLVRHGLIAVSDGRAAFASRQGRVMGRPGLAKVTVEVYGRTPRRVWVGGHTRTVFETRLEAPSDHEPVQTPASRHLALRAPFTDNRQLLSEPDPNKDRLASSR